MDIEVGCVVSYATGKSGVVRFVGETDFAAGEWVGLELDRPEGKNNGELSGRVYFVCPPNHGLFCKRAQIKAVLTRPDGTRPVATNSNAPLPPTPTHGSASARLNATASVAAASRLQQMRDRRASGISASSSSSSIPPPAATAAASTRTTSFSRTAVSASPTPSTSSSAISKKLPPAAAAASSTSRLSLSRTPSLSLSGATTSNPTTTTTTAIANDEQLADARATIARLEMELEQQQKHNEQLQQTVDALRDDAAAAALTTEKQRTLSVASDASDKQDDNAALAAFTAAAAIANAAREAELLATIDAVKAEADAHVERIRQEFTDDCTERERLWSDQIDELRLENAAQASDVKALESDVAQQQQRLAAFAAAEQKKADEMAHALAKQHTDARRMEGLKQQLQELQDVVESVTLEKESLEMDKEIAEEHAEECAAEVERLKAALALAAVTATTATSGGETTADADELVEENRKLRAAVKALHERSADEKSELMKKLRVAQRELTELTSLREEVESLTLKRSTLETEVEDLKEQLDLASAYESMVEDLTEKNLTLDERNAELQADVLAHEELKEVHEEMEHHHNEYEDELRLEIETQTSNTQMLKQRVSQLETTIDDKDRTIDRFRDLAQRHRDEIMGLKAQLRTESGALETLKGTTHSALNQSLSLRTSAAAARALEVDAATQRIAADQASVELVFYRAMLPTALLTERDQQMLRVRLQLGRVASKADVLLQSVRRDVETVGAAQALSHDSDSSNEAHASHSLSEVDATRLLQLLRLGEQLAAVACDVRTDLFVLESHLTTDDKFVAHITTLNAAFARLQSVELALDSGFVAIVDGSLHAASDRIVAAIVDATAQRQAMPPVNNETTMQRSAVVKLEARKSVSLLAFAATAMLVLTQAKQRLMTQSDEPEKRDALTPALDALVATLTALVSTTQHFYRRAEIDLAPTDDDNDGIVAVGGDVIELVDAYATESQRVWRAMEAAAAGDSPNDAMLQGVTSLHDNVATLFKSVCRGAFTDAVATRTTMPRTDRRELSLPDATGRQPQWRTRADAIHAELLHATTLQARVTELVDSCQLLQWRIRDLERSDAQHRVVAQKLESEVLRLRDAAAQNLNEKTALSTQLTTEREQFATTLDESHKEKAALDGLNRELRKQLQRRSDAGAVNASSAATSRNTGTTTALRSSDADAMKRAFALLQTDLQRVRGELATERLARLLGPAPHAKKPEAISDKSTPALDASLARVAAFSLQLRTQRAMPTLVDLAAAQRNNAATPHEQRTLATLARAKQNDALVAMRQDVSAAMRADGWSDDAAQAIAKGESVFGWTPTPEMERPALLRGRVTLGGRKHDISTAQLPVLPLLLNRSQVDRLAHTLVC